MMPKPEYKLEDGMCATNDGRLCTMKDIGTAMPPNAVWVGGICLIKSVMKALNILSYVANVGNDVPIPLGVIAQAVGLNLTTCCHIIDTLCECCYLEKVSRKEGYILGPMSFCNTRSKHFRHDFVNTAFPYMKRLCESTHDNVSISTLVRNHLFVPYSLNWLGEGDVQMGTLTGRLYESASGRLLMSYLDKEALSSILQSVGLPNCDTWAAGSTEESMLLELKAIRQQGIVIVDKVSGELSAVSCPVFCDKIVVGTIGVSMHYSKFIDPHLQQVVEQTKKAAKLLSRRMQQNQKAENCANDKEKQ